MKKKTMDISNMILQLHKMPGKNLQQTGKKVF